MTGLKQTIGQKVKTALDGRSNRWLSLKVGIAESDISKKLNDKLDFTATEISQINKVLKCEIKL